MPETATILRNQEKKVIAQIQLFLNQISNIPNSSVSDLTGPRFEPHTSRYRHERVTAGLNGL